MNVKDPRIIFLLLHDVQGKSYLVTVFIIKEGVFVLWS